MGKKSSRSTAAVTAPAGKYCSVTAVVDAQEPQLPALSHSLATVARRDGLSVPDDYASFLQ